MMTTIEPCISRRYRRHGMLSQLAAFEAVARLGSATRAAEALCIAQDSLVQLRMRASARADFEAHFDAAANDAGLRVTVAGCTTPASVPTART